jgi:hypothetical protein
MTTTVKATMTLLFVFVATLSAYSIGRDTVPVKQQPISSKPVLKTFTETPGTFWLKPTEPNQPHNI